MLSTEHLLPWSTPAAKTGPVWPPTHTAAYRQRATMQICQQGNQPRMHTIQMQHSSVHNPTINDRIVKGVGQRSRQALAKHWWTLPQAAPRHLSENIASIVPRPGVKPRGASAQLTRWLSVPGTSARGTSQLLQVRSHHRGSHTVQQDGCMAPCQ